MQNKVHINVYSLKFKFNVNCKYPIFQLQLHKWSIKNSIANYRKIFFRIFLSINYTLFKFYKHVYRKLIETAARVK